MTFNPASFNPFANVTNLSDRQVQRLCQRDEADAPLSRPAKPTPAGPLISLDCIKMSQWLRDAAARFDNRSDNFALGKGATCRDIADKLLHFGSFASDRQEDFARKLVEWSLPRGSALPWMAQEGACAPAGAVFTPPVAPTPAPAPETRLDRLFGLMQRLSKLTIGDITIARKNGDSLCWVKLARHEQVVGKIEGGRLTIFASRLRGWTVTMLEAELLKIEADPEAAAVLHGKASGRCAVCSRDLTDPESIARGIGPICAEKFQF